MATATSARSADAPTTSTGACIDIPGRDLPGSGDGVMLGRIGSAGESDRTPTRAPPGPDALKLGRSTRSGGFEPNARPRWSERDRSASRGDCPRTARSPANARAPGVPRRSGRAGDGDATGVRAAETVGDAAARGGADGFGLAVGTGAGLVDETPSADVEVRVADGLGEGAGADVDVG